MSEDKELEKMRIKKRKEMMKRKKETKDVTPLNSSNFEEFIKNASVPVIVDFWAAWCMPCKIMAPVMEELADDYAEKAIFAKLNIDENLEVANRYNVMSIPLFMIFKQGRPVEKIVGAVGRGPLEDALKKQL
jgi:thioredoxin 1